MLLKSFKWCVNPFFKFSKRNLPSPSEEVILRHDEKKEKLFMRPGTIDEEPDSMDTIISDPSSFPIIAIPPVTPSGPGVLIRNSTQSSFGRLSRISTNSKYVYFFLSIQLTNVITKCDIIRIFSESAISQVRNHLSGVWLCLLWFQF